MLLTLVLQSSSAAMALTLLMTHEGWLPYDLPHDLVAAFRATLEETRQASLLLHVVDYVPTVLPVELPAFDKIELKMTGSAPRSCAPGCSCALRTSST